MSSCGESKVEKVSEGHRKAIKFECSDDPDKKLCAREKRRNFLEAGGEFVTFEDLTKDQERRVKLECIRKIKSSLAKYNNCLEIEVANALGGTITDSGGDIDTTPIGRLEKSVVRLDIIEMDEKESFSYAEGGGSGIIISDKLIATNCHVALNVQEGPRERFIEVKKNNKEEYALAKLTKIDKEHDICIIEVYKDSKFKLIMTPVKRLIEFDKLERGDRVTALGTPRSLEGYASSGSINYLGLAKSDPDIIKYLDGDTKIIIHDATIDHGSSGGPLFDKSGNLIGLNTLGIGSGMNIFVTVSADHITDLWRN